MPALNCCCALSFRNCCLYPGLLKARGEDSDFITYPTVSSSLIRTPYRHSVDTKYCCLWQKKIPGFYSAIRCKVPQLLDRPECARGANQGSSFYGMPTFFVLTEPNFYWYVCLVSPGVTNLWATLLFYFTVFLRIPASKIQSKTKT